MTAPGRVPSSLPIQADVVEQLSPLIPESGKYNVITSCAGSADRVPGTRSCATCGIFPAVSMGAQTGLFIKITFPHERLEKRCWRDWWSEDFSWQALERKP